MVACQVRDKGGRGGPKRETLGGGGLIVATSSACIS
jgi:hypothetical protein